MMIAEIRLYPVHGMPTVETLAVTTGPSNPELGTINLAEAREMVASASARWIGEPPPEAIRPPTEPAENLSAPEQIMPGTLSLDAILARFARADAIYGKMEPLRPEHLDGSPLSAEELALYREAYPEDEL